MPGVGSLMVTSRGYWKTNGGLLHKLCSSTEKHLFTSLVPSLGLVYEVRFKRKVEISSANNLYFLGDPADLSASGEWNDGYQFIFSYDDWVLAKRVNGSSSLIASGDFAYPYSDWVTLTVWRDGAKIYLFVDGLLLDEFTDGTITYGYVGIGMVESVADVSPLLVDYVKVYYSSTPPYTWY